MLHQLATAGPAGPRSWGGHPALQSEGALGHCGRSLASDLALSGVSAVRLVLHAAALSALLALGARSSGLDRFAPQQHGLLRRVLGIGVHATGTV